MIDPTERGVGRGVIYRVRNRNGDIIDEERGVISSFSDHYVFVRYGTSSTAQATDRNDLFWERES